MTFTQIFFYFLAGVIVAFSVLSVTTRRILRAAVYLLFVLMGTAAFYFMVNFFFLAAVQLIVYIGGIVVLIIFSVLLTSQINDRLDKPEMAKVVIGGLVAFGGLIISALTLWQYPFTASSAAEGDYSVAEIGRQLLNYGEGGYVLPFEVISILLLAAMVGAIIIAKRIKPKTDD